MANAKITALTAATSAATTDIIPFVEDPAGTAVTKKITRANFLKIGTDIQAYDADLAAIAALTATTDNMIQSVSSAWASRTPTQVRTALSLVPGTDVQVYDSDLATIAGLTATTGNFIQSAASAWASRTVAQVSVDLQETGLVATSVGFRVIPQNSKSTDYTTVAADSGKHILHPTADNNARAFTIDEAVAYPVGTTITFVNLKNTCTITVSSGALILANGTDTKPYDLAVNGIATAIKAESAVWVINGTGLS